MFTLMTLANARPGGQQGLLAPTSTALELAQLSSDELLHLDLNIIGVTASGRGLLDSHRAYLGELGCVSLTGSGNLTAVG